MLQSTGKDKDSQSQCDAFFSAVIIDTSDPGHKLIHIERELFRINILILLFALYNTSVRD